MSVNVMHTAHRLSLDAWHFEGSLVGGLLIVTGLYLYGISRVGSCAPVRGGLESVRPLFFGAGQLVVLVALASPIDAGASRSFAFHMLQHVLLATVAAPLLVLGVPRGLVAWLQGLAILGPALKSSWLPIVAASAFTLNMWIWHLPVVYDQAVANLGAHISMHLTYLSLGVLFWWPLAQERPLTPVGKVLYLFVSGFPMMILAFLLLASPDPLYTSYAGASIPLGMSALTDQQVGAIIMGSIGEMAAFVAFTVAFRSAVADASARTPDIAAQTARNSESA